MEQLVFVAFQIFNFILLALWLTITFGTLVALQRRSLSASQHITWATLIILVPFLGAVAFWVIQPPKGEKQS